MYKCEECDDWTTEYKRSFIRHQKRHLNKFKCKYCCKKFKTEDEKQVHEKLKHDNSCPFCPFTTKIAKTLEKHIEKNHNQKRKHEPTKVTFPKNKKIKNDETPPPAPPPPPLPPSPPVPPVLPQNRFRNMIFMKKYKPNNKNDLLSTQAFYRNIFKLELKRLLKIKELLKFNLSFTITFNKFKDDELVYATPYFNLGTHIILHEGDIEEKINLSEQKIVKRVEEFLQDGSGWVYDETVEISLKVYKYKPPRGGKYFPIPSWIKNKKAVINIKNDDDKCFLYCVQAARMYADGRVKKKKLRKT